MDKVAEALVELFLNCEIDPEMLDEEDIEVDLLEKIEAAKEGLDEEDFDVEDILEQPALREYITHKIIHSIEFIKTF